MKRVTLAEAAKRWSRPERVVLAVSADADGRATIIALGWKMNTSGKPPMVAISVNHKAHSHKLISEGKEFVLAVPGEDLWKQVIFCGTCSGRDVDKFKATGLTPLPASLVKPPLIKECIVNLECKLVGQLDTGDHTIFAGEIVAAWASGDDRRNLISVGDLAGYELLGAEKGYRLGAVRRKWPMADG